MPRSTSKSAPQDTAAIVAAVLAALQSDGATVPAAIPAKGKGKQQATKQAPRTIKNPDAHASTKQVWYLCSQLFQAHYGAPMPKPLTMGDVQAVLDDLS